MSSPLLIFFSVELLELVFRFLLARPVHMVFFSLEAAWFPLHFPYAGCLRQICFLSLPVTLLTAVGGSPACSASWCTVSPIAPSPPLPGPFVSPSRIPGTSFLLLLSSVLPSPWSVCARGSPPFFRFGYLLYPFRPCGNICGSPRGTGWSLSAFCRALPPLFVPCPFPLFSFVDERVSRRVPLLRLDPGHDTTAPSALCAAFASLPSCPSFAFLWPALTLFHRRSRRLLPSTRLRPLRGFAQAVSLLRRVAFSRLLYYNPFVFGIQRHAAAFLPLAFVPRVRGFDF